MIDQEKTYKDIGVVLFKTSKKAKSLNITVKPFLPVKVSVPEKIDFKRAESAVLENTKWILKEQGKMQLIEQQHSQFAIHESYQFKDRTIHIEVGNDEDVRSVRNAPLEKTIFLERSVEELTETHISLIIYEHIIPEMKDWCKVNLVPKVREFALKHDVKINKVSIRDNTTRWASLGKNNDMNLSLYLATLPEHLIDYVIIHELAHDAIKDHSKAYWMHLKSMMPNALKLDKELRGYGIGLV